MTQKIKLNIGCGPSGQIKGFDNLDNSPVLFFSKFPYVKKILYKLGVIEEHQLRSDWSNVIRCNASKRLPYGNLSVWKIYTSHFLEHIPREKGLFFLKECQRVLINGGVIRIVVPDLLVHAQNYVMETKKLLIRSTLPSDREYHDKFLNTIYGAYLNRKRYGAEHCYMYDLPTLVSSLKYAEFHKIRNFDYRKGEDEELWSYDSRPEDSLHIEAWK